jgi:hypothetical protein
MRYREATVIFSFAFINFDLSGSPFATAVLHLDTAVTSLIAVTALINFGKQLRTSRHSTWAGYALGREFRGMTYSIIVSIYWFRFP